MLNLVLLTPNTRTADAIEQLTQESGVFNIVLRGSPIPIMADVFRALHGHDVAVILVDLGDWEAAFQLVGQIQRSSSSGLIIGFRPGWNAAEQAEFEAAGISGLLHEPFSPFELQAAAYDA